MVKLKPKMVLLRLPFTVLGNFKDKLSLPDTLRVMQHGAARTHNYTLLIMNITLPQ